MISDRAFESVLATLSPFTIDSDSSSVEKFCQLYRKAEQSAYYGDNNYRRYRSFDEKTYDFTQMHRLKNWALIRRSRIEQWITGGEVWMTALDPPKREKEKKKPISFFVESTATTKKRASRTLMDLILFRSVLSSSHGAINHEKTMSILLHTMIDTVLILMDLDLGPELLRFGSATLTFTNRTSIRRRRSGGMMSPEPQTLMTVCASGNTQRMYPSFG